MEFFSLTKPGREWNEDRLFVCEDFAFVLDGATSLTKEKYSSFNSDAEWCSQWWKDYLIEEMKSQTPLCDIVREGIKKHVKAFKALAKNNTVTDFPSTTIAAVRRVNGRLEIYILGDSSLVIKTKAGFTFEISEARVDFIDKTNLSILLDKAKKENLSLADTRKKYPEPVLEGRLRKNTRFGYSILSNDPKAADNGIYTFIDENLIEKLFILSDGFSQIYDTMYYLTKSQFASKINSLKDAEKIYSKLYKLQEKDSMCHKYPRFKLRDDASFICLKF